MDAGTVDAPNPAFPTAPEHSDPASGPIPACGGQKNFYFQIREISLHFPNHVIRSFCSPITPLIRYVSSPYDSRHIANIIIDTANERGHGVSIMRLLKLAYMAHGWSLALYSKPLVNEYVQAWRYGPVIPSIYFSFRPRGIYDLPRIELPYEPDVDDNVSVLISRVQITYENKSDALLSKLTHKKGGPWHMCYEPGKYGIVIPNELIEDHFSEKVKRYEDREEGRSEHAIA